MFLLSVATYFILTCLAGWMVLFPAGRELFLRTLTAGGARVNRAICRLARRQRDDVVHAHQAGKNTIAASVAYARRHYVLCIGGVALMLLPPLLAVYSGSATVLRGFDAPAYEVNTQVAQLLQGEQLVPPPALPPLLFTTVEVERERPMLLSASRDWALMNAEYTQRLLTVFRIMKERHGYDMAILEGYRSPERQNVLAGMGGGVTNAAAFQSWHQYGLAADCAFLRNGKVVISEKDPWAMRGYTLYGEAAESVGLTWGGRWKMRDFGHTELRLPGVMKRPVHKEK